MIQKALQQTDKKHMCQNVKKKKKLVNLDKRYMRVLFLQLFSKFKIISK